MALDLIFTLLIFKSNIHNVFPSFDNFSKKKFYILKNQFKTLIFKTRKFLRKLKKYKNETKFSSSLGERERERERECFLK